MSRARQVLPGTTYLITRRCTQRQFLLTPTDKTNAILLYCLAIAAARYGIQVHSYCFLSNHYHLVCTDPRGVLPEFLRYFNEFTARALNASYGRWEALWASDGLNVVRLLAPEDIVAKIAYTLANPVAAGLVVRADRWPGLWSNPRLVDQPAITVRQPTGFFRPKGPTPESASLQLVRAPGFSSTAEFRAEVTEALRQAEDNGLDAHRGPDGQPRVLGAAAVLRQKPTDSPASNEPHRELNPRIAARDKWKRVEALQRLKSFLEEYRAAWRQFRDGVRTVLFPAGTYLLRLRHGVACAPP